ncbi:hypothetical protein SUGI_0114460 [Cryptomeria japonica]|uniref:beta-glucosidase 12 n=1 Tax=Cryptomeria japonica TaxID=3369 RepID=UPI002408A612|nr:beta-glucosidase 12 [Cryptomeria japonica]GLJ09702.1 hypothetical protein SUGI_0114460 [Cryptomeria japonica]
MDNRKCILCLWLLVVCASANAKLNRRAFPHGFMFGTASSAYQYEGAAREGGRRPSIWDTYSHTPGNIVDGSNGDVAVDHYHRYKEDVKLMKKMGMESYRFSISWSRILPYGSLKGGINKAGVAFYNKLINELLLHGIKPLVTLFHFDSPQSLQDEHGGFLGQNIVRDFADFSDVCFSEFGDRVKFWVTFNEPHGFAAGGYDSGTAAPGRHTGKNGNLSKGNSATEPYIVAHNIILAHAAAVSLYKSKYQAVQNGSIGITLESSRTLPYSNTYLDKMAAQRAMDFVFGWFMDPIAEGDYPSSMRNLVGPRLPKFSKAESLMVNGSFDFVGLNYYSTRYAYHVSTPPNKMTTSYSLDSQVNLTAVRNGVPIGPLVGSPWLYVYPRGMRDIVKYVKDQYNNPPIFITENGIDEVNNESLSLQEALNDTWRIDYYSQHLRYLHKAIREGSDVRGYFAWSLLDNFEWTSGYTVRFGLHYVDYKNNLKRYPKASVRWFRRFLK